MKAKCYLKLSTFYELSAIFCLERTLLSFLKHTSMLNLLTHVSDCYINSPYNFLTLSSRQEMRIWKSSNRPDMVLSSSEILRTSQQRNVWFQILRVTELSLLSTLPQIV